MPGKIGECATTDDSKDDDLGTLREVSEYIGHHPNTIRRWVGLKLFPSPEGRDGPYPNSPLLFSWSKVKQRQADRPTNYPCTPAANHNKPPTANDNSPGAGQAVCPHCGKPISDA